MVGKQVYWPFRVFLVPDKGIYHVLVFGDWLGGGSRDRVCITYRIFGRTDILTAAIRPVQDKPLESQELNSERLEGSTQE